MGENLLDLTIYIYTHNSRVFYSITKKFREERIRFIALNSFKDIPPTAQVVLTTQADLDLDNPDLPPFVVVMIMLPFQTLDEIVLHSLQHLLGVHHCKDIMIAIDPGTRLTGIAVFLDGNLLHCREFSSIVEVTNYVNIVFHAFPNQQKTIKIGNGYRGLTRKFLHSLTITQSQTVQYVLVNESRTSKNSKIIPKKDRTHSVHEEAAIIIGYRQGQLLSAENMP